MEYRTIYIVNTNLVSKWLRNCMVKQLKEWKIDVNV